MCSFASPFKVSVIALVNLSIANLEESASENSIFFWIRSPYSWGSKVFDIFKVDNDGF